GRMRGLGRLRRLSSITLVIGRRQDTAPQHLRCDSLFQSFDLELQRLHLVSPLLLDSSPGPVVLQQPRPEIILHLLFLYLFSTFSGCSPHLTADKNGQAIGGTLQAKEGSLTDRSAFVLRG